jgi:hypothetical protein
LDGIVNGKVDEHFEGDCDCEGAHYGDKFGNGVGDSDGDGNGDSDDYGTSTRTLPLMAVLGERWNATLPLSLSFTFTPSPACVKQT